MAQFFAMDKSDAQRLEAQLRSKMETESEAMNWYALLDAGFDYGRGQPRFPGTAWPLYCQPEWGELRDASPLLIEASWEAPHVLPKLLRHCQGRPMLAFVASELDAQALCDAWQRCLQVETDDRQGYLLRFADTRIASALPQALHPASWQRLCAPLRQWLIVDRVGNIQPLTLPQERTPANEEDPWVLSDGEMAALLQESLPDTLADQLHDHFPELLPPSGAQLHGWLQRAGQQLAEQGVENAPDQLTLAVAVCLSRGRLLDDARLPPLLADCAAQNMALSDGLAELLEADEYARE
ncbi:DUF4123 domain-containing protein [Chromobacterium amazonense]|uniref:DUF4123 domain-containing protein n=1 Tax=Chromobacterium amazonense TaxID=1382803 RepID=UPI00237E85F4|nr:DUF4123 domain-containing protein [Chromobacterium amazonense]MDE1716431.1 DUF4123 domain-containing protein [Chromobacterium amazonense]